MNEEVTDEQLIELLEGNSNPELEARVAQESDLKKRYDELKEILSIIEKSEQVEVPSHLKSDFELAILKETSNATQGQWSWMQIAAAVTILVVGFSLGKWSQNDDPSAELAQLRDEIHSLREATLTNTLQRHSASERILAVNRIEEKTSINQELIATLVTTLNSDESPNVRYAALQALKKFISNEEVRAQLVKSLEEQSDPLIQISLISILVEAEERSAIAPLKEIIQQEQITPEVKLQAETALKVLT